MWMTIIFSDAVITVSFNSTDIEVDESEGPFKICLQVLVGSLAQGVIARLPINISGGGKK